MRPSPRTDQVVASDPGRDGAGDPVLPRGPPRPSRVRRVQRPRRFHLRLPGSRKRREPRAHEGSSRRPVDTGQHQVPEGRRRRGRRPPVVVRPDERGIGAGIGPDASPVSDDRHRHRKKTQRRSLQQQQRRFFDAGPGELDPVGGGVRSRRPTGPAGSIRIRPVLPLALPELDDLHGRPGGVHHEEHGDVAKKALPRTVPSQAEPRDGPETDGRRPDRGEEEGRRRRKR
mmetsp:Transcript_3471/g.9191  ORF Transcript_3471/g.9191 Transcript_3471/m.9191 type:complete len:229 (-) Transcript_3471:957-1643(-)